MADIALSTGMCVLAPLTSVTGTRVDPADIADCTKDPKELAPTLIVAPATVPLVASPPNVIPTSPVGRLAIRLESAFPALVAGGTAVSVRTGMPGVVIVATEPSEREANV